MSDTGLYIRPLPRVGQELGRFLIERELPRGGQARVYRAWQLDLQRAVALKLLPATYASEPEALTRFRREIENVARISHANVVHVYEAGDLDGHAFFTMEYIEGEDAETLLKKGPMGPDEAATLIEAVARGVQEAHQAGIVHRDIKPGNIIVRSDGTPVLTDFGLAQDLRHSNQLTQTGVSMGTPAYMAPEQARGERARVGKRSDVYALGATLFTLLTGKRPAEGASAYEIMVRVAESQGPKWPRATLDDVPRDLRAIVERAMQNDPGKRYESATELADDLERFLHGEWVVARSRTWLSRLYARGRRFIPAAAVILLAAGITGAMVYSGLTLPEDGGPGALKLDDRMLSDELGKATPADIEKLFSDTGSWARSGASVQITPAGEMMLAREGRGPLFISHRENACWGDFTLQSQLLLTGQDGPLEILVGMTADGDPDDAAYGVALGDGATGQWVLRRLGVPVLSGRREGAGPLLPQGRWVAASLAHRSLEIAFTLSDVLTGETITAFEFADDFPALAAPGPDRPRHRFGIRAGCAQLGLREVAVSHAEPRHSAEEMLFAMGQYAEAMPVLSARLAATLAPGAAASERDARARLLLMRARCHERVGQPEDALADAAHCRALAENATLRAQAALLAARVETRRRNDEAALENARAAGLGAPAGLQARAFHQVFQAGEALRETEPARALRFYDHVANEALGTPGLVAAALLQGARIRLQGGPGAHAQARSGLRRVGGASYETFAAVQSPALVLLLELRWQELLSGAASRADEPAAADEVRALGRRLAAMIDGWGVTRERLLAPLVRAAWLERLASSPLDAAAMERAGAILRAARRAATYPGEELWADLHLVLLLEERPPRGVFPDPRLAAWQSLARAADPANDAHDGIATICDFFLGAPLDDADARRRADLMRRNLRRELASTAPHWLGDAGAERFADYLAALFQSGRDRAAAEAQLEAAALPPSGILRLLRGRAQQWLPPEGG